MTDFTNDEAAERFQRILEGSGVSNELEKLGVNRATPCTFSMRNSLGSGRVGRRGRSRTPLATQDPPPTLA